MAYLAHNDKDYKNWIVSQTGQVPHLRYQTILYFNSVIVLLLRAADITAMKYITTKSRKGLLQHTSSK